MTELINKTKLGFIDSHLLLSRCHMSHSGCPPAQTFWSLSVPAPSLISPCPCLVEEQCQDQGPLCWAAPPELGRALCWRGWWRIMRESLDLASHVCLCDLDECLIIHRSWPNRPWYQSLHTSADFRSQIAKTSNFSSFLWLRSGLQWWLTYGQSGCKLSQMTLYTILFWAFGAHLALTLSHSSWQSRLMAFGVHLIHTAHAITWVKTSSWSLGNFWPSWESSPD